MKMFTSTELNKNARKIFRAVDLEGSVRINHEHYPDKIFIITGKKRGEADPDQLQGEEETTG